MRRQKASTIQTVLASIALAFLCIGGSAWAQEAGPRPFERGFGVGEGPQAGRGRFGGRADRLDGKRDRGRGRHQGLLFNILIGPRDPQTVLEEHPEADLNGDGEIDREEMRQHIEGRVGALKGQLLERNPELDANIDGTLDRDEMRAARPELIEFAREKILAEHPESDPNGDGELDKNELRQFMQSQRGPHGRAPGAGRRAGGIDWLVRNFDEVDTDGDGKLSKEELTTARDRFQKQIGQGREGNRGERREGRQRFRGRGGPDGPAGRRGEGPRQNRRGQREG